MNPLAIVLVILSAIMHVLRNLLTKEANSKHIFIWLYHIFAAILFLPIFVYFMFAEGISNPAVILIAIFASVFHSLFWVFLSKSYEDGDLSKVYPIMMSSPALVLVFAIIFLQEQVTLIGIIGILLVDLGIYVINLENVTLGGLLEPIKSILKDRTTQFAFLTLIAVAVFSLIDKVGVASLHPLIYVYFINLFIVAFLTPYVFYRKDRSLIGYEWNTNKKSIFINGFLVIFGYSLILIAFTMEKVSYVVGLREVGVIFAVLLGGLVLKERHQKERIAAAILIFLGVFLISIAS